MKRAERYAWAAVVLAAIPVAMMLVSRGHGMVVRDPAFELPQLIILAAAEEIVFRGGLHAGLTRRPALRAGVWGISGANAVTSLLFGTAHLLAHTPLQAASVIPVSLLFGLAFERSGRLVLPIALHAAFNVALYLVSAAMRGA